MSIFPPFNADQCPPAHGHCRCPCHSVPGTKHVGPCCWPEPEETPQQSILRRIAERGLMVAQQEENSQMINCWQNMLDEIERMEKATFESEEEQIQALIKRMRKGNGNTN